MSMRLILTTAIVFGLATVAAKAETVILEATLSGKNEVPPVERPGTGSAKVWIDTETREMRWTVTVDGLSAPLSAAHFHGPSTTLQNAGVEVPIAKKGDQSPFTGSATLDPEQMADLIDGYWYVNIHTPNHPPGEIRGQLLNP